MTPDTIFAQLVQGIVETAVQAATDRILLPQGPKPNAAMTTEDVLALFSISDDTLVRWRQEEDFPAPRKLGALNRYVRAEVDAWWLGRPKVLLHRRAKPNRFDKRGLATTA